MDSQPTQIFIKVIQIYKAHLTFMDFDCICIKGKYKLF